jgi:hypothetical protein
MRDQNLYTTTTSRSFWDLLPGTCTWYLVPGIWYLVPGTWYLGTGTWYLVPGTWYLVPGTRYQVPGTRYQVPGTRYQVPGTRYQVQVPGTRSQKLLEVPMYTLYIRNHFGSSALCPVLLTSPSKVQRIKEEHHNGC